MDVLKQVFTAAVIALPSLAGPLGWGERVHERVGALAIWAESVYTLPHLPLLSGADRLNIRHALINAEVMQPHATSDQGNGVAEAAC